MNLQQLEYFATLAETGHFGDAAKRLCISQPALSNSIKNLEKELGIRLFTRTGTAVLMTSLGQDFHQHVIKAISEINLAVETVNPDVLLAQEKPLRIGSTGILQQAVLPRLIADYKRSCGPQASFQIMEAASNEQCIQLLADGKMDIALCNPTADARLCWAPVKEFRLVAVVLPSHPLAQEEYITLNDLRRYPTVSYQEASAVCKPIRTVLNAFGINPQEGFLSEGSATAHLAANEETVAIMLDAFGDFANNPYVTLPIEGLEKAFHVVGISYRYEAIKTKHVARFVEYVETAFANLKRVNPLDSFITPQP